MLWLIFCRLLDPVMNGSKEIERDNMRNYLLNLDAGALVAWLIDWGDVHLQSLCRAWTSR